MDLPAMTQEDVEHFAARLSLWARPGLVLLLEGDLGSGKSTFARAFLKALAQDDALDVPSPSFSILQVYDETRVAAAHADLFRLSSPQEIQELGLGDILASRLLLLEWPDRLSAPLGEDVLSILFTGEGAVRRLSVRASGYWRKALERDADIAAFLARNGLSQRPRYHFEGDASSRRYEVLAGGPPLVLMDMPERPDGPPVKDGKPYSRIAHLAEDVGAVIAVNTYLHGLGYSAPEIIASDRTKGLALMEHLGSSVYGRMILAGTDMREPMREATAVLADMASRSWPKELSLAVGAPHAILCYDRQALLIEADLLPSWYWPFRTGSPMSEAQLLEFEALWSEALSPLDTASRVWTLRDFHSPNLLWLPERQGLRRVGLIDTQDCVMGHPAYDLASLLQDARVDIPETLTTPLLDYYCSLRRRDQRFDEDELRQGFALLGAQRATKILGIFARLAKRDGKPAYLRHMPRVARQLAENLKHPALARLAAWFQRYLPLEVS